MDETRRYLLSAFRAGACSHRLWASLAFALILITPRAHGEERVQAVSSDDGRLEVFVSTGQNGWIHHAWQTQVGSGANATQWAWKTQDTGLSGEDFVAGRDSQGTLFIAAIDSGVIRLNTAMGPGGSFGNAQGLNTHDVRDLQLVINADGRIEFFTLSNKDSAWSTAEISAGNRTFANHYIGGTKLRELRPTAYHDRLALVALGGDRGVWWISQLVPNGNWANWRSLGGHDLQTVAAATNADGRLEVVALGDNKALYHRYEQLDGSWSEWETLAAGPFQEPLSLGSNKDGRLEIFLRNAWTQIVHAWQTAPNGIWSDFSVLPNVPTYTRAQSLTKMPDGRLVFVAVGPGAEFPAIYVVGQIRANGVWEAWSSPPTGPPPKPFIKEFTINPGNGNAPVGTTFTFGWNVLNCGSNCNISLVGKTGIGSYNTVFFSAFNLGAQGQLDVKPDDTNTLFTLTASGATGSASWPEEVKLMGPPTPDPCPGCMVFYFKMEPTSPLLPCSKKSYFAPDAETAKQRAETEFSDRTVIGIDQSEFEAVGC